MKYNWDKEEFIAQRQKLETLYNCEADVKTKVYLQKVMDCSDDLFNKTFNNFPAPNMSKEQRLTDIANSTLIYSRYYSIISSFFSECCELNPQIVSISEQLDKIRKNNDFPFLYTGAKLSQSNVLSLVNNFYQGFDEELYAYFLRAYEDRFNFVKFFKNKIKSNNDCNGYTLFIDGVQKNFIAISETAPIETYACAIHEYGHAIHNLINPQISYTDNNNFFVEIASIFPEMVAIYENQPNFSPLQQSYYLYSLFLSYYDSAELLCLHTPVINLWKECNFKFNFKFFHELKKYYDIDYKCFKELSCNIIDDEGIYILSYIISLELFHIYKQDKKRALELFKKILKYPVTDDLLVLFSEDFTLNKYTKVESEITLDKLEKQLEKKKVL